jgi:hypothetical protein
VEESWGCLDAVGVLRDVTRTLPLTTLRCRLGKPSTPGLRLLGRRGISFGDVVCPFELNGVCNDDTCSYRHLSRSDDAHPWRVKRIALPELRLPALEPILSEPMLGPVAKYEQSEARTGHGSGDEGFMVLGSDSVCSSNSSSGDDGMSSNGSDNDEYLLTDSDTDADGGEANLVQGWVAAFSLTADHFSRGGNFSSTDTTAQPRYWLKGASRGAAPLHVEPACSALSSRELSKLEAYLSEYPGRSNVSAWMLLAMHYLPRKGHSATAVIDSVHHAVDVMSADSQSAPHFRRAIRTLSQALEVSENQSCESLWLFYLLLYRISLPPISSRGDTERHRGWNKLLAHAVKLIPGSCALWDLRLRSDGSNAGLWGFLHAVCLGMQALTLRRREDGGQEGERADSDIATFTYLLLRGAGALAEAGRVSSCVRILTSSLHFQLPLDSLDEGGDKGEEHGELIPRLEAFAAADLLGSLPACRALVWLALLQLLSTGSLSPTYWRAAAVTWRTHVEEPNTSCFHMLLWPKQALNEASCSRLRCFPGLMDCVRAVFCRAVEDLCGEDYSGLHAFNQPRITFPPLYEWIKGTDSHRPPPAYAGQLAALLGNWLNLESKLGNGEGFQKACYVAAELGQSIGSGLMLARYACSCLPNLLVEWGGIKGVAATLLPRLQERDWESLCLLLAIEEEVQENEKDSGSPLSPSEPLLDAMRNFWGDAFRFSRRKPGGGGEDLGTLPLLSQALYRWVDAGWKPNSRDALYAMYHSISISSSIDIAHSTLRHILFADGFSQMDPSLRRIAWTQLMAARGGSVAAVRHMALSALSSRELVGVRPSSPLGSPMPLAEQVMQTLTRRDSLLHVEVEQYILDVICLYACHRGDSTMDWAFVDALDGTFPRALLPECPYAPLVVEDWIVSELLASGEEGAGVLLEPMRSLLKRALSVSPGCTSLARVAATLELGLGAHSRAQHMLENALVHTPFSASIWAQLAWMQAGLAPIDVLPHRAKAVAFAAAASGAILHLDCMGDRSLLIPPGNSGALLAIHRAKSFPFLRLDAMLRGSFPCSILLGTHLVELSLRDNALSRLPAGMELLRALRTLDLSGNQFSGDGCSLSSGLWKMPLLSTLRLARNQLRDLPGEMKGIRSSLTELDLSSNLLRFVPGALLTLGHLRTLLLANNSIAPKGIPSGMGTCLPMLSSLDLYGNPCLCDIAPS